LNTEEREKNDLDELLIRIGHAIEEDEAGIHVTNPERMRCFLACGEAMKLLFSGKGMRVIISPHDMYPSMGTIEVVTKGRFCLEDLESIELFTLATGVSSNYEIYPKLDGTIVLAITFYGLTKKMKG
jgi:hypothetical protein